MKNVIRNRFRIIAFSILFAIVFLLQKHTLGQTIIYPGNGSNAELLAAKEVRRYIYMRTDSLLDIQAASTLPPAGDLILVAKDNSSITSLVDGLEVGHVARENQIVLKTVILVKEPFWLLQDMMTMLFLWLHIVMRRKLAVILIWQEMLFRILKRLFQ